MEEKKVYTYSYSAAENNEIKKIREKYEYNHKPDSKLEQLRKLDRSVHNSATAISLIIGIAGTLMFGFGMSSMTVWSETMFVLGIFVGTAGILIAALAYPVYNLVAEKKKKKIAPMILSLTDELIKK